MLLASLIGVVLVGAALGAAVWVAGIALLGWVVSRDAITAPVLVRAGVGLAATAIAYVVLVALVRALLPA